MKRIKQKLYDHQKEALRFIEDKNKFALFMEQGTGKTAVIIKKFQHLFIDKKIDCLVVIAPNAIKPQWPGEIEKFCELGNIKFFEWHSTFNKKKQYEFKQFLFSDLPKVALFNVEAFQSKKVLPVFNKILSTHEAFIVVDEAAKIKTPSSLRTKAIIDGSRGAKYKAILTGTPTPNSPFDIFSQFEFLEQNYFKMPFYLFRLMYGVFTKRKNFQSGKYYNTLIDEKTFHQIKASYNSLSGEEARKHIICNRYSISEKDYDFIVRQEKCRQYKNLDLLNRKIDPITFRVMKKDCLDLPDKIYKIIYVELTPEQKKLYKAAKEQLIETVNGKSTTMIQVAAVIGLRLQQICGGFVATQNQKNPNDTDMEALSKNPKLDVLLDDIEDQPAGKSIIIWARFVAEIKQITKTLNCNGYNAASYYGATPTKQRKEIIKKFQNKELDILVINPACGAEGLNLQVSDLHYVYSNVWNGDARLQLEDRSHRIGQKNNVVYTDLVCKNTINEKLLKVLKQKEDLINYFRDKKFIEEL